MRGEVVQLVFTVFALVLSAAAEELLPTFAGAGLPLLLALTVVTAPRQKVLPGMMTAIGAGAFESALALLPPMTSGCYFVIAALLSRKEYFPRPFLVLLFPLFELWTGLCVFGSIGDVFVRALAALPLGLAALAIEFLALGWLGRRAGLYD